MTLDKKRVAEDPEPFLACNHTIKKLASNPEEPNDSSKMTAMAVIRAPLANKFVGAHVSAAKGLHNAFGNSLRITGNALALFLKSQRKWESPPLEEDEVNTFKVTCAQHGFLPKHLLPHGSYLINLGNIDDEKRKKSLDALIDDLQRCQRLGIPNYNFHPGSTVGACTVKKSIDLIAESINHAHVTVPDVTIVLETMAGQGNVVGSRFEELRDIISAVSDKSRVGVCIDTCHIFSAGYDIKTAAGYEKTMSDFENIIGFKYLRGVHLNDSKTELGSGKDRHENIGKGQIGSSCFRRIMNDSRFDDIPLILETPLNGNDDSIYREEIELLYSFIQQ